ncbi:MAG: outer membrane protein transport protein [Myxococcales bacterium]|nr:outer membrane protein transport protein [Myxococcales bacterium]
MQRILRLSLPLAATLAGASTLLAPGSAQASGLDAPLVGTGFSGPVSRDAAAIWFNPAQLGYLKKGELLMGAGLIIGDIRYTRNYTGTYQTPDSFQFKTPLDPAYIDATKSGMQEQVKANPIAPTGNIFFAYPVIKDRLVLGAGFYVPYAAALNFPKDGPQRLQVQQAFIVSSNLTGSVALRINDYVALGAGASYVMGFAELSKLQDFAGVQEFGQGLANPPINQANDFGPNAPSEVRELDVLSRPISLKRAVSHSATFNVGVAINPTKKMNIGLNYQHSTNMHYHGRFAIDMNDSFFTHDLASQGVQFKPLVTGDALLTFKLPKRLTAGFGYDINEFFRVDGFFSYIFYSDIQNFAVTTKSPDLAQPALGIGDTLTVNLPRMWKNTVWVEGNLRYWATKRMRLSGTLGYQSPASPDSTIDTASPDGHRLIGGVGGLLQVSERVGLVADARMQGILPRTVTGSDYDLGNGTYKLFIAAIAGHLKINF